MTSSDEALLEYPAPRASGCPFDPPPALTGLLDKDRITRVKNIDGTSPWLVAGFEDQRALLSDPRVSADQTKPGYPHQFKAALDSTPEAEGSSTEGEGGNDAGGHSSAFFILMDDPEHSRLRRMVTPPFMVKRINALKPRIQAITDKLIDDLLAGPKPVDLIENFALPLPSLVVCELLGVTYESHDYFQETSKRMITRSTADADGSDQMAAMRELGGYIYTVLQEKKKNPGEDVLTDLNERIAKGELTDMHAAEIGMLLLFAGHETTANMIALGTAVLLENPEQLAKVRDTDNDQELALAVDELLRFLNVTHNGRRRVATDDIEYEGITIKAGEGLIFPNDVGNRDPKKFSDPDTLDVTRDARDHLSFGFGPHQCLGQPLARAELQIVYRTLLRRIPTLKLAKDRDELSFKDDAAVYGIEEMPVTW